MKSIIIAGILLGAAQGAAQAGFYVNVESNSGFFGSDYTGTVTEAAIGYETDNLYVQFGPAYVTPDDGESDFELSGKIGGFVPLGDVNIYGELSGITGDDTNSYATKVGMKWAF